MTSAHSPSAIHVVEVGHLLSCGHRNEVRDVRRTTLPGDLPTNKQAS